MASGNSVDGPKTFEIGLVMAGSISAGAYTAGVIDFLIQALDQWEQAKGGPDPDCPRHNISLKVMAGASGGGITAAIAAAQLGQAFEPATGLPATGPVNNKFFESWVERIDIAGLLGTRDLKADPQADVRSVLDSTVLDQIAASAFDFPADSPPATRKYLANPLHVLVTLTNLRGVPYRIYFHGEEFVLPPERRKLPHLLMHEDHMRFAVGDETAGLEREVRWLPPGRFDHPNWKMLADAAKATGAFPVALAPRKLSRPATEYDDRKWLVLEPVEEDGRITGCGHFESVPPRFPEKIREDPRFQYDFLCVDGGAVDNKPLEHARRILEGNRLSSSSESRGDRADHALIAIAPFPDLGSYPVQEPPVGDPFLLDVIRKTIYSEIQQARFRPEQLTNLANINIFNRFLIAPDRDPVPGAKIQSILASASVGGFGGFLSRAFRVHDFQLGRLNCQQFLKSAFVLPYDEATNKNPLFNKAGWTKDARKCFRINGAFLPIIPLMGTATKAVTLLDWPSCSQGELDALRVGVETRLGAVVQRLIDRNASNLTGRLALRVAFRLFRSHLVDLTGRLALRVAFRLFRSHLVDKILENIKDDLRDRKLLE